MLIFLRQKVEYMREGKGGYLFEMMYGRVKFRLKKKKIVRV